VIFQLSGTETKSKPIQLTRTETESKRTGIETGIEITLYRTE